MPLTVGGGVANAEIAQRLLHAGAEKVTVNSRAVESPALVGRIANEAGQQAVVASIDVRRTARGYEVFTHCGARPTGRQPGEVARSLADAGAGEILVTAIDRDGTGSGFDLDLIAEVAGAVTVPVIACGGAAGLPHCGDAIRIGGANAVAAGSLFVFHGRRRAVLISFPTLGEIEAEFSGKG